ncbi:rhomboid family intramembrane serine protease [Aequorivita sp. SDUM287046]|uniref:Rhomboid family intramembrane serine protease n=1 Tax=Aequorivita aurantiaca TaxID=3053356 RepID=A0ABT8DHG3_9FLAO|nr:rhomboid family intramembrane serine protease [Aequorivita aurantiaca]MDN3724317.1 rhomboid family intramembrane serine protease [Aequorivita aurantiaca]
MSTSNQLKFSPEVFGFPLLFVMVLWIVFWVESRFSLNFNSFGVYPRDWKGLRGIIFSPFIHGSLKHLFNNSVPLFVLSSALFYFYRDIRWKVLLFGLLFTGIATWLIGRPSLHIGASGIVYMLAAFLFFKGVFSKQYQLIALSLIVVFLYGGMLWYVFPVNPEISWEGHLSGFFIGLLFAFYFKRNPIPNKKYDWEHDDYDSEKDPFLKQFDENGNFIEIPKNIPIDPVSEKITAPTPRFIKIVYTLKKKSETDLE